MLELSGSAIEISDTNKQKLLLNIVDTGEGGSLTNSDALLLVTVPINATSTMSKGNTILSSITWPIDGDNEHWCAVFTIPYALFDDVNEWTITTTTGSGTVTNTIKISSSKYYVVQMVDKLNLYNRGLTYDDVTGGWRNYGKSSFKEAYIVISADVTTHPITGQTQEVLGRTTTKTPIDVTNYHTLHAIVETDYASKTPTISFGLTSTLAGSYSDYATDISNIGAVEQESTIDVSNAEGYYYVTFTSHDFWTGTRIHKVWLE